MMDHERTEKELEAIFEEIQHYYEAFANDALALQERTPGGLTPRPVELSSRSWPTRVGTNASDSKP